MDMVFWLVGLDAPVVEKDILTEFKNIKKIQTFYLDVHMNILCSHQKVLRRKDIFYTRCKKDLPSAPPRAGGTCLSSLQCLRCLCCPLHPLKAAMVQRQLSFETDLYSRLCTVMNIQILKLEKQLREYQFNTTISILLYYDTLSDHFQRPTCMIRNIT